MSEVKVTFAKGAANAILSPIDDAVIYIISSVRRRAKKNIGKPQKRRKPSNPGESVNTQTGIYPDTIKRHYDQTTMTGIVGPDYEKANDGGFKESTLPHGLEYGGTKVIDKPSYLPASLVGTVYKKQEADRLNAKRRRGKVKLDAEPWTVKNLKYVEIPAGTQTVEPRPTMRLAFNKIATADNLKAKFALIGIKQPQLVEIG